MAVTSFRVESPDDRPDQILDVFPGHPDKGDRE